MADNLFWGSVTNGAYKKTEASQEATKSSSLSTSKTDSTQGSQYNEEMFLKLLVAEMQYQDPMQPTDNSQYVQQLASFTQIEAIQSLQSSMESMQANSLVGKAVVINHENEEVHGTVELVKKDDNGDLKIQVNGKLYSVEINRVG